MQKELENFGLSKNESEIYLFLVKKGETTTGAIINETGIANSRVYESLNGLIKKGLVTYNLQKKGKYFTAVSPDLIKQKELDKIKKLDLIIPQIKALSSKDDNETHTAIYEGYSGFKTAFEKIIDDCPKNGEIKILGFSEQAYSNENLKIFLANMNLKSAKKKQKLKIILDYNSRENLGKDREKEKYTEIRYMPQGYISPAAIDIFQDYVYICLWEEKPKVIMIKSKLISTSYHNYFDVLWFSAKKYKQVKTW